MFGVQMLHVAYSYSLQWYAFYGVFSKKHPIQIKDKQVMYMCACTECMKGTNF